MYFNTFSYNIINLHFLLLSFDYLFFALDFNYIIELQTKSVNKKTRCCLEPKR